ncbi:hypothetical protein Btru_027814 [Bulinus truncatus]|nr:hypothetical protein Btru_027814 [Bulinus truncatus]
MSYDDMDRFLQRMRSDLMFELRKIEHGERPVTGQNHRENIQHFFEKNMVSAANGGVAGKYNLSTDSDRPEVNRPEAIVIEVQGIIERRPVSSILQSAAFRRQLEHILSGSLPHLRSAASRRPALSQQNRDLSLANTASTSRVIPERQLLVRQASNESLDSFASALSSVEEDFFDEEDQNRSVHGAAAQPHNVVSAADHDITDRPISPPRQELPSVAYPERVGWNEVNARHRNELVEEISDLLHSRLVSSALNGEFRATLELQVQDRIRASGTDGHAVEDFIRRLPATGVQRNDFSNLGINQAGEADNWETISVTSVSAQSVPYAQTNAYLGREIQSLKAQMNEMKNMLKLTFDLQLDIQRAVRQEVAAAMNSAAATCPLPASRPISDTHCLICLDHYTDTVLYQCGHMCVCYACGRNLISRGHSCPVCRAPIKDLSSWQYTTVSIQARREGGGRGNFFHDLLFKGPAMMSCPGARVGSRRHCVHHALNSELTTFWGHVIVLGLFIYGLIAPITHTPPSPYRFFFHC